MTPVLGDPNVTAFLKALCLHQFCSTCTSMTCQLHVAENSCTLTTYVSPFKANTSANWNAVSRQVWRRCHTSVGSGDLNQAPPKQSAVCSTVHLHNTSATCELTVYLDGQRLRHECHPTYLGVSLERTLSYREHLTKTAGKLKNRNNLLMKLAGSTWGSSANTLRSSALALCYSAAEYCFPVWSRSAHTSQVEVQLNSTMRLIYLVPSVLHLSHGFQPYEGRLPLTSWPIQPDILSTPLLRLTSSKPLWLDLQPVVIKSRWRHNWKSAQVVNSHLVCDLTIRQPGFDFPRQQWFLLNRFRTEQGTGNGDLQTLICGPCGETQTMSHIVESCSLTKLNGGLSWLHSADEDAVSWLSSYGL